MQLSKNLFIMLLYVSALIQIEIKQKSTYSSITSRNMKSVTDRFEQRQDVSNASPVIHVWIVVFGFLFGLPL